MSYPEYLWDYPEPNTTRTVNLNDRGLSEGDVIDPYLNEHFGNGVRVEIEPGEYRWNRSAPHGSYRNAAMVGLGDFGDVTFNLTSSGRNRGLNVLCTGGTILWENITIRGGMEVGNNRIRCDARTTDSEVVFKHVRMPDGNVDGIPRGEGTQGVYAGGSAHVGTLRMLWCHIEGFVDNGIYADGWAGEGRGQVIVAGGLYKNNNISNIRLGNDFSRVYKATVVVEDHYPHSQTRNQRGIRIRRPHQSESTRNNNILIDDTDIYYERGVVGTACISAEAHLNRHSHVTVRNTRVKNDSDDIYAILNNGDGRLVLDDVHVTGRGETRIIRATSQRNMPSNPEEPNLDPWWGEGVEIGDGGTDVSEMDELAFISGEGASIQSYQFVIDGNVVPLTDESYPTPAGRWALATSNFDITSLGGDYSPQSLHFVEGATGNGWGDAYYIDGTIKYLRVDTDDMWVEYDREEWDWESEGSEFDHDAVYEEGYADGHDSGYEDGYAARDEKAEGEVEIAYSDGYADGYAACEEGHDGGGDADPSGDYQQGYEDGYEACQDEHDTEEISRSFLRRWLGIE